MIKKITKPVNVLYQKWHSENSLSKGVIIITLLLVIFSYLPSLVNDYVPQDQWRAFRYSTFEQPYLSRTKACMNMVVGFYIQTGRPLVWIGECIDHTFVGKISDFAFIRPFVLAIVLLTVLYMGAFIAPYVGGWSVGVITSALFVLAPGYSFIYMQGATGAPLLICLILSIASFSKLKPCVQEEKLLTAKNLLRLLVPFILFFLACTTYSIWAFIVVSLALLYFGFDKKYPLEDKFKHLILILSFYCFTTLAYYAFIKASIYLYPILTKKPLLNLGSYMFSMELSPSILFPKFIYAIKFFNEMYPFSFKLLSGSATIIVLLFALYTGLQKRTKGVFQVIIWTAITLVTSVVVLLGSVSPWFFSRFNDLALHHLIPWQIFLYVSLAALLFTLVNYFFSKSKILVTSLLLIVFLLGPAAIFQNRLTFSEAIISGFELGFLRSKLKNYINKQEYINHVLLIIQANHLRPQFIEKMLKNSVCGGGQNAVLVSATNPVSMPWVINALLRERDTFQASKEVHVSDYLHNPDEAEGKLINGNIPVLQTDGKSSFESPEKPYIINFTELTSDPLKTKIIRKGDKYIVYFYKSHSN
ncbi:MAG: hypothetical protein GY750_15090 [Lentisphaerae bacterium]|nr:hypothetical protein [Lentisphaerota bacterium]MCP4102723.1 hypothetical protein [Lentisphaerota bacterium]